MAKEFKQYATNIDIIVKNATIETHHSISMVERYHGPLRRVYSIIIAKIPSIEPDSALQISFKAINNSVGPNRFVPILLIFGIYLKINESDALFPSITQCVIAMRKVIDEI